jgi:hypothetical protein
MPLFQICSSSIADFSPSELDPKTLSPVHGLCEFDALVTYWENFACMRLQNPTRRPWENHLIGLGISAVRSTRSLSVLANMRATEGMQCIARNVVELVSKMVHIVDHKDAAYRYDFSRDVKQQKKIYDSETENGKTWLSEATELVPDPDGTDHESVKPNCQNIGMKAEYQYLCLSTHNHVSSLKRKSPTHWDYFIGQLVTNHYEQSLILRGATINPFVREPAIDVERYLHICAIAMQKAVAKIVDSPELLVASVPIADEIKRQGTMLRDAFNAACPKR